MKIKKPTYLPFLFLALLCMCLTGCFKPVKYGTPLDAQAVQDTYGDIALSGDIRDKWWEAYGDASLNGFVETVLAENPSLQSAYLRILDSQYALKQTESSMYPSISGNLGFGGSGRFAKETTADLSYNIGVSASYEIDIWGKVRAQRRISELSVEAQRDAAQSAAMTLVGNVVTQWLDVQYYRDRQKLTKELLELSEQYYDLVQKYYQLGQSNGMDILEQRQQIETLRSTLKEQETNIRKGQRALAILAANKVEPEVAGSLPSDVEMGGTVDVNALLENRPDIRSARISAEQADAKVVVAFANRLPSLRLSLSLGFRSNSITDLFKALIWDLGASMAANIFDGFNLSAAEDRAKIAFLQERYGYALTVMQAVSEVEQALLEFRLRVQLLEDARAQLKRQQEILDISREYFIGGSLDYNRVLSALRSMISASQSELEARRSLLRAQITLYKSMGGSGWLKETTGQGETRAKELLEALDKKNDDKK